MKKTLSVNLGGTVFQIDEDAYILLDNYLNNLRYHFRKEEGGEEIVRDMEMRISELFAETMEGGQQVITIDNVEAVIARMGKPEEFDEDAEKEESAEEQKQTFTAQETYEQPQKRLFRDPNNRILGGVLSGIAAYFGWDVVILRLIVALIAFAGSLGVPWLIIYVLAWIIIPPAKTATERLKMKGEAVNMENIGKTVTDSFNEEQKNANVENSRSPLLKFADAITKIIGLLVKVFLGFLLICCIPALFGGVVALFSIILAAAGVIVHIPAFLYDFLPYIEWSSIGTSSISMILFVICGLLVAGIPLVGVLQIVFQSFGKWKPMSTGVKIGLLVLWLIALIAGFIFFFHASFIADSIDFISI